LAVERLALRVEHRTQDFYNERAAVLGYEGFDRCEPEQPVDRGYRATRGCAGIQHRSRRAQRSAEK